MKKLKIICFAILFVFNAAASHAQTDPTAKIEAIEYILKEGDILTYEVREGQLKYDLKIQFTSVPSGTFDFEKLAFNWSKTGTGITQSGKVIFVGGPQDYLDLYNLSVTSSFSIDFDKLTNWKIFNSHGIWLSVMAQMDILLSGEFDINMQGDTVETKFKSQGKFVYKQLTLNGNPSAITIDKYLAVTNQKDILFVQSSEVNPLIILAYVSATGFLMNLKSIEKGTTNTIVATSAPTPSNTPSIPSVKIGNQTWMTQNLDVSKFRNGDIIPEAKPGKEWVTAGEQGKPAWCYYDNNAENGSTYGKLYNWYAINDVRGLAPVGWYIPSDAEWLQLLANYGGESSAAPQIKSTQGWGEYEDGTNESGFSALPGGFANPFYSGLPEDLGSWAHFWSSTESSLELAKARYITYGTWVAPDNKSKGAGLSVRCLKN